MQELLANLSYEIMRSFLVELQEIANLIW